VREAGDQVAYVLSQVDAGLDGVKADQIKQTVIAYEPVWAIGTGRTATPEDAQEVCGAIRARITEAHGAEAGQAVRIQYGGSVKAANIASIMAQPDVDGALVGGASLDAEEFASICRYREHVAR
jgi:triosephosphate isomerase